MKLLMIGCCCK